MARGDFFGCGVHFDEEVNLSDYVALERQRRMSRFDLPSGGAAGDMSDCRFVETHADDHGSMRLLLPEMSQPYSSVTTLRCSGVARGLRRPGGRRSGPDPREEPAIGATTDPIAEADWAVSVPRTSPI